MSLDIGRLDQLITLVSVQTTADEYGSPRTSRTMEHRDVWATFAPVPTKTRTQAPGPMPAFAGTFTLRFLPVNPRWLVSHRNQDWKIVAVSHYGRDEYTVLQVERVEA